MHVAWCSTYTDVYIYIYTYVIYIEANEGYQSMVNWNPANAEGKFLRCEFNAMRLGLYVSGKITQTHLDKTVSFQNMCETSFMRL